jgi:thioredoxin 1
MLPAESATRPASDTWQVICLCAGWCGVCREWQAPFQQAAQAHPGVHFAWVDVEDEADAMGDYEVETFPTVLIARGDTVCFLGPIAPSGAQLARLIGSLQAQPQAAAALPEGSAGLLSRLAAKALAGPRL